MRTYREFVEFKRGEADDRFAVQVLKDLVQRIRATSDGDMLDDAHRDPGSTGHEGWDRLVAGTAWWTGVDHVSDMTILNWADGAPASVADIFDPLAPQRRFALSYLRTPIPLRERGVCLARGNLQGV